MMERKGKRERVEEVGNKREKSEMGEKNTDIKRERERQTDRETGETEREEVKEVQREWLREGDRRRVRA
jgi:hypothetical protein